MAPIKLRIRVTPKASRNQIAGWRGKQLAVKVTAPPVEGAANEAVIKLLSKQLGLRACDIQIASGDSSRDKLVVIEGCEREDFLKRLKKALDQ